MRKFHDNGHANNRLSRCFIMYRKADGKWRCGRLDMATKTKLVVNDGSEFRMDDVENTSFLFPRLGYVNTRHQCLYFTRSSRRMWKVGLVPENIVREPIFKQYFTMADDIKLETALKRLFLNEYPSFKECLDDVQKGRTAAKAFSRDFCVGLHEKTREVVLYYRNMPIGHYDKDEKAMIIGDVNSHYVQKFLEVVNNEVGVLV